MTQLTVTIENGVDSNFIRRIIENLKGVVKVSYVNKGQKDSKKVVPHSNTVAFAHDASTDADAEVDEWIKKMTNLSNSVDPSIVDMSDDRTRYLMSK